MELSFARTIVDRRDDVTVTISTPFPELDREVYSPIPVVHCNRRRLITATVLLLMAFLWKRLPMQARRATEFLLAKPELQSLEQTDLVIDLSGDMLTEDYGIHIAYSHYLPLLMALALRKPVMVCAQSIGPFRLTRLIARFIFRHACLITSREAITTAYLRQLGIPTARIEQTADLAFLLDPVTGTLLDETLAREGLGDIARPMLGISLSALVKRRYRKRNPLADVVEFSSLMADIIDAVCEQCALQAVFVPHVTGPRASADDRLFADSIASRMKTGPVVVRGDYQPDLLKGIIGRCSIYMGARMHANIAALSSGVPTLAIAYSHKTKGIMRLLGLEDHVCDIATLGPEVVKERLASLFSARESVRLLLQERIVLLRQQAAMNVELASHLLDNIGTGTEDLPLASVRQRAGR